jgi:predicted Zn-ribbon and HTH transcriptional regulator
VWWKRRDEPPPSAAATKQAVEEDFAQSREEVSRASAYYSRPRCRRCGWRYEEFEEGAILLKHQCAACEAKWLEKRLNRMVDRLGRKAALQAVRRVTR